MDEDDIIDLVVQRFNIQKETPEQIQSTFLRTVPAKFAAGVDVKEVVQYVKSCLEKEFV